MSKLYPNGETPQAQKCPCHFGHHICNENVNKIACNSGLSDIVVRTNYFITKFVSCAADICLFMFRSQSTSFYGSLLWCLSSPDINYSYPIWRKCERKYGKCHLE